MIRDFNSLIMNPSGTADISPKVLSRGKNFGGVSPWARWSATTAAQIALASRPERRIACKALDGGGGGSLFDLLECADWILAPWDLNRANADPSKRPHIVNNSWGYSFGGFSIFRTAVQSWRAAGIFPAFAAGKGRRPAAVDEAIVSFAV